MDLVQKKCTACEGGVAPLAPSEARAMLAHTPQWQISDTADSISRTFHFHTFAEALAFANKIGALAEEQGHHPDLHISWGALGVGLTTHAIGGLSENDFIMAAKIDALWHAR